MKDGQEESAEAAGFDESIKYIHDYLTSNPPFDVGLHHISVPPWPQPTSK